MQYSQENTCSGRCSPPVKDYRVLLLQNTYGCCFWIFAAENAFFNWLRYLLLTVTPVFPPNSFGVKRQKQPLKLLLKKGVFRNFASFTGKQLCWSLFLIELQTFRPAALLEIDSNTDVFLWNLQDHLIWSLRTPASETCSFTWTALFNNLHFWLKLMHML